MNNIFGNFGGCGCNKNCDPCCNGGMDSCWIIILLLLCGCQNNIDPCSLIMFMLFNNCCCQNQNNCCN